MQVPIWKFTRSWLAIALTVTLLVISSLPFGDSAIAATYSSYGAAKTATSTDKPVDVCQEGVGAWSSASCFQAFPLCWPWAA